MKKLKFPREKEHYDIVLGVFEQRGTRKTKESDQVLSLNVVNVTFLFTQILALNNITITYNIRSFRCSQKKKESSKKSIN